MITKFFKEKIRKQRGETVDQTIQKSYPDINTGNWMISAEKTDGHGFWAVHCEADPALFKKVLILLETEGVVFKDYHPHDEQTNGYYDE